MNIDYSKSVKYNGYYRPNISKIEQLKPNIITHIN